MKNNLQLKSHTNGYKTHNNLEKSRNRKSSESFFEVFEDPPLSIAVMTYMLYIILNLIGRFRDFLRYWNFERNNVACPPSKMADFVPLYQDYEAFYTRNLYRRARDIYNRPVSSAPGATMDLVERVSDDYNWTFRLLDNSIPVKNFGSYNYLGFAENEGCCADDVEQSIKEFGIGIASSRQEVGTMAVHNELEQMVAKFTGQEDAIIFPMGFATNALNIPILVDKHSCIISDEMNHTSLILGIRLSGAHVKRFKHNDMKSLEKNVRQSIIEGHPRTRRQFTKILVIVEGIYSMEGSIVRLPEIIQLKQRYNFLLYVDEAHSIGALGINGRGVVDYFENCVDSQHINSVANSNNSSSGSKSSYYYSSQIDVAMGTFTKSFAGAGGYVAGRKRLIDYIRENSHGTIYGGVGAMPAPICQQIISAMNTIVDTELGRTRISQLAWNTRYFRAALHRRGFIVFGNKDSPVVPIIICKPTCCIAFSRECLSRGVGIVVVGFPATSLILARARFCLSGAHTKQQIDETLSVIDEVAYMVNIKYSRMPIPKWCFDESIINSPPDTHTHHDNHKNTMNGGQLLVVHRNQEM